MQNVKLKSTRITISQNSFVKISPQWKDCMHKLMEKKIAKYILSSAKYEMWLRKSKLFSEWITNRWFRELTESTTLVSKVLLAETEKSDCEN